MHKTHINILGQIASFLAVQHSLSEMAIPQMGFEKD